MSTSAPSTPRTTAPPNQYPADGDARAVSGARVALALIAALAAVLYAWGIGSSWGNAFYSAAVRAMAHDPTAFLFGSYDAAHVVTVDKPPMALWPQVVSVWIFGYRPGAVLLPQVVEGVAAVVLLHATVRRWWAAHPDRSVASTTAVPLLAALVLALSPVTVAIDRDNNPDTLLVLFLVVSAYALTRALERGGTGWLLAAAGAVGCGFVTKMLAAWMVVPALALAFLVAAPGPVRRRLGQLLAAGAVLVVTSLWWPAMVSLWPGPKPWIGGSTDGSAWDLVLGYNGLGRVFGQHLGPPPGPGGAGPGAPPPGVAALFGGADAGPLRMFSSTVGGQISWLLPWCVLAVLVALVAGVGRRRAGAFARPEPGADNTADRRALGGWLLWAAWLVVVGAVLSLSKGIFHTYYTSELAPAMAALAAGGAGLMWRRFRSPGGTAWTLLPLGVALTVAWAYVVARRTPDWNPWFRPTLLVLGAVAVVALVLARLAGRSRRGRVGWVAATLTATAALAGPALWSATTAFAPDVSGTQGVFATAGPNTIPALFSAGPYGPGATAVPRLRANLGGRLTPEQARMLALVRERSAGVPITLAVEGGAILASPYAIGSDTTVVALGGFMGADPAPDVGELAGWVATGRVRYVLLPGPGPGGGAMLRSGASAARSAWVRAHCSTLDPRLWGERPTPTVPEPNPMLGGFTSSTLYRCGR